MINKPRFARNLERGDLASDVYWRALWALESDPIASMLSERTLKGLADAYTDGMVGEDGKAKFNRVGARVWAGEVIKISPLSILSPEAILHLQSVIHSGMFPEELGK